MNGMREAGEGRNGGGTKLSKGLRLSRGTMLLGVGQSDSAHGGVDTTSWRGGFYPTLEGLRTSASRRTGPVRPTSWREAGGGGEWFAAGPAVPPYPD